jgi:hypothetical protein
MDLCAVCPEGGGLVAVGQCTRCRGLACKHHLVFWASVYSSGLNATYGASTVIVKVPVPSGPGYAAWMDAWAEGTCVCTSCREKAAEAVVLRQPDNTVIPRPVEFVVPVVPPYVPPT